MTSVDGRGSHGRLKTRDGVKGTEIAFVREVIDPSQTREMFVEMAKQPAKDKPLCYPKKARSVLAANFATARRNSDHRSPPR